MQLFKGRHPPLSLLTVCLSLSHLLANSVFLCPEPLAQIAAHTAMFPRRCPVPLSHQRLRQNTNAHGGKHCPTVFVCSWEAPS